METDDGSGCGGASPWIRAPTFALRALFERQTNPWTAIAGRRAQSTETTLMDTLAVLADLERGYALSFALIHPP